MVNIVDLNSLVSACKSAAEDTSTEFLDFVTVAIENAEQRLTRELDIQDLVYTSTVMASTSTPTFAKPSGHLITRYVKYTDPTTGRSTVLSRKSESYLDEFWAKETSVGTPRYYSEDSSTSFKIAPCVSTNASVQVKGIRRPAALTSANTSNIFTNVYPDALFYATMLELAIWARNDTLMNNFSQLYISTRDNINATGARSRRDDTSPLINAIMEQNVLKSDQTK